MALKVQECRDGCSHIQAHLIINVVSLEPNWYLVETAFLAVIYKLAVIFYCCIAILMVFKYNIQ